MVFGLSIEEKLARLAKEQAKLNKATQAAQAAATAKQVGKIATGPNVQTVATGIVKPSNQIVNNPNLSKRANALLAQAATAAQQAGGVPGPAAAQQAVGGGANVPLTAAAAAQQAGGGASGPNGPEAGGANVPSAPVTVPYVKSITVPDWVISEVRTNPVLHDVLRTMKRTGEPYVDRHKAIQNAYDAIFNATGDRTRAKAAAILALNKEFEIQNPSWTPEQASIYGRNHFMKNVNDYDSKHALRVWTEAQPPSPPWYANWRNWWRSPRFWLVIIVVFVLFPLFMVWASKQPWFGKKPPPPKRLNIERSCDNVNDCTPYASISACSDGTCYRCEDKDRAHGCIAGNVTNIKDGFADAPLCASKRAFKDGDLPWLCN